MVQVLVGDLFESGAQTLVNTVNCVGIMGKGVALEFKKRYPDMFADYKRRCAAGEVRLGEPYLYRTLLPPWILNFPTKDHWKSPSQLSDIVAGLKYLEQKYREWGIESLAVPPLGCGFGGLEWRVVGPTLVRHLSKLDIPVELYAPPGTPAAELTEEFLSAESDEALTDIAPPESSTSTIEPGWIALVEIISREGSLPYEQKVTRTMLQSMAYFAEVAGIQTRLQFTLGKYGVRAPELQTVVSKLEKNGLCEEAADRRAMVVRPGSTYHDAQHSFRAELADWEAAIERVTSLFSSLNSRSASALAAVHFAAHTAQRQQGDIDDESVVNRVKQMVVGERSAIRSDRELIGMLRYLESAGWLSDNSDRGAVQSERAP
jgi:O-acetyl-ADP-ribose deacetylase (regulator of RNase III)/uncharacterized protein YwgA